MTKKNKQQEKGISDKSLSNLNRAGRPPGAKNKTTLFKEAMREGFENRLMVDGQKVFDACVQKAIDGDTTAMKLIMDRILPVADVTQGKGAGSGKIIINVQGMNANIDVMDHEYESDDSGAQFVEDGEFEEIEEVKDAE